MKRFLPLLVALLVVAAGALAGCIGADDEPVKPGSSSRKDPGSGVPKAPTGGGSDGGAGSGDDDEEEEEDEQVKSGQRWHYHNYWGETPVLTLYDDGVAMSAASPRASAPPPRATLGEGELRLPRGSIVPPETGRVDVVVEWDDPVLVQGLDVWYSPANTAEFIPAGTVAESGGAVEIAVTMDMTDAPHTAVSGWAFRFTATGGDADVGFANGTVWATVTATIGRPILVDPPHIDHWQGERTLPLASAERQVAGGRLPVDERHAGADPTAGAAGVEDALLTVPVTDGRVVPEGTRFVLARLAWDAPASPVKPALVYAEENDGTRAVAEPVDDGETERLYRIPVTPRMTDNPYGNQSTWVFHVVVDGDAGAFAGTITLDAWATRLAEADAAVPAGRAE